MRKLATAAISFAAAIFVSNYLLSDGFVFVLIFICVACAAVCGIVFRSDTRLRLLLVFIAASVGFCVFHISYQLKTVPSHSVDGEILTVSAVAREYPEIYSDYSRVEVDITSDNAPGLRAYVYSLHKESVFPEIAPGDTLSFTAQFKAADTKRGEPYDLYTSAGIYLLCYLREGGITVTGRSPTAFLYLPAVTSNRLNQVAEQVFSEDTSAFLKALTTGYRFDLRNEENVYGSIRQAGIAHVVAVSGMHLAFLVSFLSLIFRRKKSASLICLPIIWLFALVAGASPSILRAAVMQSAVLIAPLVHRENDSLTSLSAALALLLLLNPDACASVSLQMSFAAMVGIVLISPRIYSSLGDRLNAKRKKLRDRQTKPGNLLFKAADGMLAGFAASLGAQTLTLPLAALYFGYVPLYSIIVNLLVLWLVSIAFILGLLACVLGIIWLPLGIVPGFAAGIAARVILWVAKLFAGLPYSAVYMENRLFFGWLILVYIIFALCWFLRGKRGFRAVIPTCLAVASLCCAILINELELIYGPAAFTAVNVGQGQSLVITDSGSALVIDCGGNDAYRNAGDITAACLMSGGRSAVDVLALTHFDTDHVNGAAELMGRVEVQTLIIPQPDEGDERAARILEAAVKNETKVYIINEDTQIEAGDISLTVYVPESGSGELMYLTRAGNGSVFISGDAYAEDEYRLLYRRDVENCDIIVAGHHGSEYATSDALLETLRPSAAVISSGYNTYGHPAPDTIRRLEAHGIAVYRTDERGSITFRLE